MVGGLAYGFGSMCPSGVADAIGARCSVGRVVEFVGVVVDGGDPTWVVVREGSDVVL